jgi:hypothetical protein
MAGSVTADLSIATPPYHLPESILFAYPTRMSASWEILPEKIIKEPLDADPGEIRVVVSHGTSRETRNRSKNPLRWLAARSTLKLSDQFIYDARFETDGNIAHQIQYVAAPVLLARQSLAPVLGAEPEIHVILRSGASGMSQEIHRILGIPVILSDARVEAQIVNVSHESCLTNVALLPEIFRDRRLGDPIADLPEKVFIARKTTRFLLNDAEISQLLESRGFRKYYFEEIPVAQQWQIVANARQIVAVHGAALASLAFNQRGLTHKPGDRRGLQLIELFSPGYQVDLYRRFAAVLNAHWCAVRGKITPQVVRDLDEKGLARSHEKSPFAIDPGTLEMALDYSEQRSSQ